jgi:hypothetical protein
MLANSGHEMGAFSLVAFSFIVHDREKPGSSGKEIPYSQASSNNEAFGSQSDVDGK